MENPIFQTLHYEVETFKQWANSVTGQNGEWETEYPHWDRLYYAVEEVLEHTSLDEWNTGVYEYILYILARDNEVENIMQMLLKHPRTLTEIAFKAISYSDYEARWQIAYGLGELTGTDKETHQLLSLFLKDNMSMLGEGHHLR